MPIDSNSIQSEAIGIHQSDIIIRTALLQALRELRKNDGKLLDSVFSKISTAEKARAKEWFLRQEIPVVMTPRLDEAKTPCISIALAASDEAEVTLGDVHYKSSEDNDSAWPALVPNFSIYDYDPATGILTIPADIQDALVLVEGMSLVDTKGTAAEILEILDNDQVRVAPTVGLDFRSTTIKGQRPVFTVSLESCSYRETYQLGVHVDGEPVYLSWLYSIVAFCLFRYKQQYLEARGFERSVFSAAEFDRNTMFEAEFVFSRYLNLTGYVRQYWPKTFAEKVSSVSVEVLPELSTSTSIAAATEPEPMGIFQSELVLRNGIVSALEDLRRNPWLLEYVFSTLRSDGLTRGQYEGEIEAASRWFMRTKIPVLAVPILDEAQSPCISIKLQSSSESEVTLGDIHYISSEPDPDAAWPALATFTPASYDPATGIGRPSEADLTRVPILTGFFLIDRQGGEHEVLEVLEDESFRIAPKAGLDLRGAIVKSRRPNQVRSLESVWYRDQFQIGVHVDAEPVYLTWLHSILVFCLLRYKQQYLETEGLERTMFGSTDFSKDDQSEAEFAFTRYVNLTGYCRQYWPKEESQVVGAVNPGGFRVIGGETLPADTNPDEALWIGEFDTLSRTQS